MSIKSYLLDTCIAALQLVDRCATAYLEPDGFGRRLLLATASSSPPCRHCQQSTTAATALQSNSRDEQRWRGAHSAAEPTARPRDSATSVCAVDFSSCYDSPEESCPGSEGASPVLVSQLVSAPASSDYLSFGDLPAPPLPTADHIQRALDAAGSRHVMVTTAQHGETLSCFAVGADEVRVLVPLAEGALASVHLASLELSIDPTDPRGLAVVKTLGWRAAQAEQLVHKAMGRSSRFVETLLCTVNGMVDGLEPPVLDEAPPDAWTPPKVHFVMEVATGGDLMDLLLRLDYAAFADRRQQGDTAGALLPEPAARYALACVVEGLRAMHRRRVAHLDVKPDNLLIHSSGLRITDFNHSEELDPATRLTPTAMERGTAGYQSPEAQAGRPCGAPADVFAAGKSLEYMLAGPVRMHMKLGLPGGVSSAARSLVEAMTREDPVQRPTLRQVRRHPFFAGFDWVALRTGAMPVPQVLAV